MNKPEPLSDEQIDEIDAIFGSLHQTYRTLLEARDKQWEEMLSKQEPVSQFRKVGCADWYDGFPDKSDGFGPYESRTLYAAPVDQQAETHIRDSAEWDRVNQMQKAEIERLRSALEKLARLGNGDQYGNSDGNMIARAALEQK